MGGIGFNNIRHIELVEELVETWSPGLSLRRSQVNKLYRIIEKVANSLGIWDVVSPTPVFDNTYKYQFEVLQQVFNAATKQYIPLPYQQKRPIYSVAMGKAEGIYSAYVNQKANLNTISEEDAVNLPGLGKVSSNKLISYRKLNMSFVDWDEVKRVSKISTNALERLQECAFIGEVLSDDITSQAYEEIEEFGVARLLDQIEQGQISWLNNDEIEGGFELVYRLIEELSKQVLSNKRHPEFWVPSTKRLVRNSSYFNEYEERNLTIPPHIDGVSYVYGSKYLDLLKYLLQQAVNRIRVSMFFFYVEDSGPGRDLLDLLVAAKDRGVSVKVILDHDVEGDYHNARNVNEHAFAEMLKLGIDFRKSYPDRTNHTKLICIDDFVLCGSHNLTSSSFYRYEDTSFLIESSELANETNLKLERFFDMLNDVDRIVYLDELEFINQEEKSVFKNLDASTSMEAKAKISTKPKRAKLALDYDLDEERLHIMYRILNWMESVKISETTAYVLASKSCFKLKDVKKLEESDFYDFSMLDEPFKYRRLAGGIFDYLKSLE